MAQSEQERTNLIVSLAAGGTRRVVPLRDIPTFAPGNISRYLGVHPPPDSQQESSGTPERDVIYTSRRDMPSLERLLEEYQIASAVFEREPATHSPIRLIAATSIAAITLGVGITLVALILLSPSVPNPFVALFVVLAGCVLLATLVTATRES